jgi:transcription elongation GreA/GreB family factor
LICDGNGDVLKSSFPVENNAAGIEHLLKEISATARHREIPQEQIFLGGEDEADIKSGRISVTSPIARALIGRREGDVAEVDAPGGRREYEVVGIRYE